MVTTPKRPRVTQQEIARRCGVSRVAVAVALGNNPRATTKVSAETAARIREVARELGYRPSLVARQLAGAKSGVIGMLVSHAQARYDHVRLGRLVSAVEAQAYERRLRLMVGQYHSIEHLEEYIHDFEDRGVDGVLCVNHEVDGASPETIPQIVAGLTNAVFVNQPAGMPQAPFVQIDYGAGVRDAVAHLVERGRKKIGEIYFSLGFTVMQRRHQAYLDGLKAAGLPYRPQRVWAGLGGADPEPALVEQALDQLMAERVDAILASNDRWGAAVLRALAQRGVRVPQDVAVVGYNNQDLAEVTTPALTSIDLADQAVGAALLSLFDEVLSPEGRKSPLSTSVPTRLAVREST
jgi:DNA-binding LacI/PurR family transcriptional regulator